VQWGNNESSRVAFPAERLDTGTMPKGSQWTKNPVPACIRRDNCPACFYTDPLQCPCYTHQTTVGCVVSDTITGTQFAPPAPGVSGGAFPWAPTITGSAVPYNKTANFAQSWGADFNIVDLVQVPSSLKAGGYLLSWRWDGEASPEVFMGCADVTLV
jgi:hypothetical protein